MTRWTIYLRLPTFIIQDWWGRRWWRSVTLIIIGSHAQVVYCGLDGVEKAGGTFFFQWFILGKTQIKHWLKKKEAKPHHRHECDLGQGDIRWPASDWLSSGTASTLNPPVPAPASRRSSVGVCANNCVLFAGTEEIAAKTAVRLHTSLWPRPFRGRHFGPRSSCNAIKWGGHAAGHVSICGSGSGYLMAVAAFWFFFISGQCTDKSESPSATMHLDAVLLRMQQGQKSLSAASLCVYVGCCFFYYSFFTEILDFFFYCVPLSLHHVCPVIFKVLGCRSFFGLSNDFVVWA